ncbi:MAG: hypothetical protein CME32_07325 [Gimesia sp.]|nr:hypothetical protein [Gimesia sp.]
MASRLYAVLDFPRNSVRGVKVRWPVQAVRDFYSPGPNVFARDDKRFDVDKDAQSRCLTIWVPFLINQFLFQHCEEGFHGGIVRAVPFQAQATFGLVFLTHSSAENEETVETSIE